MKFVVGLLNIYLILFLVFSLFRSNGRKDSKELEQIAVVYGDVRVKRKRERRKRRNLLILELFYEYAKNSSLHGLRFIVDRGLPVVERLFWFLTVIISILICIFYICDVILKWKTSPVLVSMNEQLASVESVPFPSVTICPQYKVNPKRFNYTEKRSLLDNNTSISDEDFNKFRHISFLCDPDYEVPDNTSTIQTKNWNVSAVNDIIDVALNQSEIFFSCNWHNKDCGEIFTKTLTADGVCYTANNLAAADIFEDTVQKEYQYMESHHPQEGWSLEGGYNNSHTKFFTLRGRVYNSVPDFKLLLKHDLKNRDETCNNIFTGYKIYLHHPADLPQSSLYYYAAIPNHQSSVAISFHELNSDKSVVKYDAKIRQCYFPKEYKLRYFKIYTANNCYAECLSNYTYKQCHCVAFYMPHNSANEVCNFYNYTQEECVMRAKIKMTVDESDNQIPDKDKCRCLPACNVVEYDAEILKTRFQIQSQLKKINAHWKSDIFDTKVEFSLVEIFYKKSRFVTMQRRELFGFTDLLANIGGLLGVFLGFSFLSLIELLYYLSFRIGYIFKRDLNEEKAQERSNLKRQ